MATAIQGWDTGTTVSLVIGLVSFAVLLAALIWAMSHGE
jgi:hypothetical protein